MNFFLLNYFFIKLNENAKWEKIKNIKMIRKNKKRNNK